MVSSCGVGADAPSDLRLSPSPSAVAASSSWQRCGTSYATGLLLALCDCVGPSGGLRSRALENLRLGPPPSTIWPSRRWFTVRGFGQQSWSAAFAESMGDSGADANGRPCGRAPAAPASDHWHNERRFRKWLSTSFRAQTRLQLCGSNPRHAAAWCLAPNP